MMGPVLAACLLIILSTAWISQANGALCKKDGGVCTCNDKTKSVDCSSKGLTAIPSNIPLETTQLHLNLNSLSKLSPTAFQSLTTLSQLYLSNNQLQTLPPGVFNHLVELDRLDLNYNQLKSLPSGIFDKLTELKELSLSTNQLQRVPEGAFNSLEKLTLLQLEENPWDCSCNDILYLSKWIREKEGKVNGIESATCVNKKAVLEITEEEAAEDCVYPNTTTAIPTTIITTLASSNDDDIPELPVPQENFQKFLGYQEPDHLPTQPQCLMSISGYLGLMMSLVLTSAAILYVIHFLKKA
uniref:Variable lymphocyte receptor A n=1 Tax=Eptatretus stoutii TaxID=7765 RepID=Q32QN7_EPTST|nr:variable lymphocyte receptor A [Eptatretus stoutii]